MTIRFHVSIMHFHQFAGLWFTCGGHTGKECQKFVPYCDTFLWLINPFTAGMFQMCFGTFLSGLFLPWHQRSETLTCRIFTRDKETVWQPSYYYKNIGIQIHICRKKIESLLTMKINCMSNRETRHFKRDLWCLIYGTHFLSPPLQGWDGAIRTCFRRMS